MSRTWKWQTGILLGLFVISGLVKAEVSSADWEALKKEIADLRKDNAEIRKENSDLASKVSPIKSSVDKALEGKYGPGAAVTTKVGKLTISGLVQVWYYTIQKDQRALFNDPVVNDIADNNQMQNIDSFRVRRTELKFAVDVHENISAEVMIDPAREVTSYAALPDNQANSSVFKRLAGTTTAALGQAAIQGGPSDSRPRLLQDAFIHYHGMIPHHDVKIGQFKPLIGEEGCRSSSQLDFVERSFLGQLCDARDQGIAVHGSWWGDEKDGRFQYWVGAFNAPGNFFMQQSQFQNRSDDNSEKDLALRSLVRPVWKNEKWGSLELGGSAQFGHHGGGGSSNPIDFPTPNLNRAGNSASRLNAWASYFPAGKIRGLWLRGEWLQLTDRNISGQVIDLHANDLTGAGTQGFGQVYSLQGFYGAMGFKLMDSPVCTELPAWAKPLEFAARFDTFQNVLIADEVRPDKTRAFYTKVYTAGINYYIKGHNAKVQANYNIVDDPNEESSPTRRFHSVRNDNFVVNFQVAF